MEDHIREHCGNHQSEVWEDKFVLDVLHLLIHYGHSTLVKFEGLVDVAVSSLDLSAMVSTNSAQECHP